MIIQKIIDRAYSIIGDNDKNRWTEAELLEELNSIILEVCHELELTKDTFTIDIFDGQKEYEYDENITEIIQLRTEGYGGTVIFPSSIQQLTMSGKVPTSEVFNSYGSGLTVAFQNMSNYGKIVLDPVPRSEESSDAEHVWTA